MSELKLKDLKKIAYENINEINDGILDFRIEEFEFKRPKKEWDFIVSYLEENKNYETSVTLPGNLGMFLPRNKYERVYKKVKIDEQGNFLGFYMYKNDK